MQVRKQQLQLDMEQQTGSKQEKEYAKAAYCHPAKFDPVKNNIIGTWSVRFMNQGKLEVVKQEMARVNIDILGISELKWMGIGKFNSDDHYIY